MVEDDLLRCHHHHSIQVERSICLNVLKVNKSMILLHYFLALGFAEQD
jgi:hypothetical protein